MTPNFWTVLYLYSVVQLLTQYWLQWFMVQDSDMKHLKSSLSYSRGMLTFGCRYDFGVCIEHFTTPQGEWLHMDNIHYQATCKTIYVNAINFFILVIYLNSFLIRPWPWSEIHLGELYKFEMKLRAEWLQTLTQQKLAMQLSQYFGCADSVALSCQIITFVLR